MYPTVGQELFDHFFGAKAVSMPLTLTVALVSLSLGRGVIRARLLVAEGVTGGLGVMTAATLLRTIGLRTWHQILMFTLILLLRILLKKLFAWEKQRLLQDLAYDGHFNFPFERRS